MPPESGWLSGSLSVTQLGVAEDRFCFPRNEGPASSPWNPTNMSQTWFYLDGCDSGIQQLSETPGSSSRDLVWNHSCDLFLLAFFGDLPFGGINPGHEWKKLPVGFLKG